MPDPSYHDPLCPRSRWFRSSYSTCQCTLIREVGERIAQALEVFDFIDGDKAAQIARNGGRDD